MISCNIYMQHCLMRITLTCWITTKVNKLQIKTNFYDIHSLFSTIWLSTVPSVWFQMHIWKHTYPEVMFGFWAPLRLVVCHWDILISSCMYLCSILNVWTLSNILIIEYTMLNYKLCIVTYLGQLHIFHKMIFLIFLWSCSLVEHSTMCEFQNTFVHLIVYSILWWHSNDVFYSCPH